MENNYEWTDNPTVSGLSVCDTDILNDCLMHLKYEHQSGNPYSLLQPVWSDKKLNNASWLISLGQSNSGEIYSSVYELLQNEYETGVETTEIVNGISITYRTSLNGFKITLDKDAYDRIYAFSGTAWYYVIDNLNTTFYLPRTNGFMQFGNTGGQFNSAGLPNITGNFYSDRKFAETPNNGNGALNYTVTSSGAAALVHGGTFGTGRGEISINASNCNSIYGNSDTVQPNAVTGYLYFYVGDTVKNQSLINVATITESLATKTDIRQASNASMPSNTYIDLTLGESGSTYTAPTDGWVAIRGTNRSNAQCYVTISNDDFTMESKSETNFQNEAVSVVLPIAAGHGFKVFYNNINLVWLRFISTKGVL